MFNKTINQRRKKARQQSGEPQKKYGSYSYYDSYRANNNDGITQRNAPAKRTLPSRLKHVPSYLAIILIICSLLYLLRLDTYPKINLNIEKKSTTLLQDSSVYQVAAQKTLKKSIFNRSKLTINTTKIADDLEQQFPELSEVVVNIPIAGHRLVFEIEPAKPSLILESKTSNTFIIDEKGRAVVKATDVVDLKRLDIPLVIDESSITIEKGRPVLTKDEVGFISDLYKQMKIAKKSIKTIKLPQIANEVHVSFTDKSYHVKFNIYSNLRVQVGAMLASEGKFSKDGQIPKSYIDVRVSGKVFYK